MAKETEVQKPVTVSHCFCGEPLVYEKGFDKDVCKKCGLIGRNRIEQIGGRAEADAARREADAAAFAEACDHLFFVLRKPQDYMTSVAFETQKESFRLAVAGIIRAVAAAKELP